MERAVRLVDEVRLLVVEISPVVQVRQRVDEGVEGEDVPGVGAVQVGFGLERQGSTGRSWKRRTPAEGTDIATMPAPPRVHRIIMPGGRSLPDSSESRSIRESAWVLPRSDERTERAEKPVNVG